MKVRALTKADFDDALALYRDLVGAQPIGGMEAFAALLNHPGTQVIGAELDGRIAAMLTLHILPNMTQGGRSYALIENVVTATDHQGQGLGRAVMEDAIRRCDAANVYKIMLLTMQEGGARGFYEKLGFTADDKFGMSRRTAPKRRVV